MARIPASGFITTDGTLIHGMGATAEASFADALATLDSAGIMLVDDDFDATDFHGSYMLRSALRTLPASADLLAAVDAEGGACSWSTVDGVACTWSEMDTNAAEG